MFIVILGLSGLFSGTETALTAISPVTIQRLADEGSRPARVLRRLLKHKGRVIAALLVGNNVVNVVLAVYATVVFSGIIQESGILPAWAGPLAASVSSVAFLLVFGEVLPKSIAVAFRTRWAVMAAYPVAVLMVMTRPITWVLMLISEGAMRFFGRRPGEEDIFDVHEIHTVAHMSQQAGMIDNLEKQLIQRAARLNDARVREIMIPRTDITGIESDAKLAEIRALFQKTPYTRIPVYRGDLDDVVGILNFKEFLRHQPEDESGFDLMSFLHRPLFVPDAMFIGDLLSDMRARRTHLAVVLDEYGGTAGLITLEDVVEMLVGRIEDEYDAVSVPFERVSEDTWLVDGRVIDERLVAHLKLELPPEALEGFDTLAGMALKAFGKIPSEGETTTYHNMELTPVRVKGHRVRRLRVRVLSPEEAIAREAEKQESSNSARRRTTQRIEAGRKHEGNGQSGDREAGPSPKSLEEPELVAPRPEVKEKERETP